MSTPRSYNLLYKPWIPVIWPKEKSKSTERKVGICEALSHSAEIQCVSHTAPFIEFGLYRLLITIVLDAYIVNGQRPTISKIQKMLDQGHFDKSVFTYLKTYLCSFDLWDKEKPFLQCTPSPQDDNKYKAVVTMFPAVPSGVNVVHWHHYREDEGALSEDDVALLLTTVSPFNFKGKAGETRTLVGDPPMYALVLGKNLFETVVLNLPRPSGRTTVQQEKENGPAWRTSLDPKNFPKTPTITQGFTWPVRLIKLKNDGAMITKAINKTADQKPRYDVRYGWRDPNAGIETMENKKIHIKARSGVPIWRDAVPLFLVGSESEILSIGKRRSRPEVVTNALRILDAPRFRVAVYGMRKKSGRGDIKVEEWFRSVLTFLSEVARDSRLSARAFNAFKNTQKVAAILQRGLRMLRPATGSKDPKRVVYRQEADAVAAFWHKMEPVLSDSYLEALVRGDSSAEDDLWGEVRRQVRQTFSGVANAQRRSADGLFRITNASNWIERRIKRVLTK